MKNITNNLTQAMVKGLAIVSKDVAARRTNRLNWDQLVGFGMLALVMWIVVQESSAARNAANLMLLAAQGSIVDLLNGIGDFT